MLADLAEPGAPRIFYPAPGLPHFVLRASGAAEVIIDTDLRDPDLHAWAAAVSLAPRGPAAEIGLGEPRFEALDPHAPPAIVAASLAACGHRGRRLLRIHLPLREAGAPSDPRRFGLYDLVRGGQRLRARCVAVERRDADARLALEFASDLHVAAIWDTIDVAIERHAPDLYPGFLHPGRLLRRFVVAANARADRGELDLVVFGGDLVDHVRPDRHVATSGSNVDHFLELFDDLTVPCCVIPGNHDFRLHPWRPRIYPYTSVALPPRRAAVALRRAGLWDALPLRRSDLRALQTQDENGRTALAEHLAKLAPAVDYRIDLGEMALTFLSTGRDVLPRWRTVERARLRTLLRSVPGSWEHPDSEGLSAAQVSAIEDATAAAPGAAIFFHAPLFNPPPGVRVEERLPRLDPGDHDGVAAAAGFERRIFASGLRQGVFFRNPGGLVRALAGARARTTVFSGHVHHAHAVRLDRADLSLRTVPFPWEGSDSDGVRLINAPALGQTAMVDGEPPGHIWARFGDGQLVAAGVDSLADAGVG